MMNIKNEFCILSIYRWCIVIMLAYLMVGMITFAVAEGFRPMLFSPGSIVTVGDSSTAELLGVHQPGVYVVGKDGELRNAIWGGIVLVFQGEIGVGFRAINVGLRGNLFASFIAVLIIVIVIIVVWVIASRKLNANASQRKQN